MKENVTSNQIKLSQAILECAVERNEQEILDLWNDNNNHLSIYLISDMDNESCISDFLAFANLETYSNKSKYHFFNDTGDRTTGAETLVQCIFKCAHDVEELLVFCKDIYERMQLGEL